ncbi:MAG TPA: ferrochelatase [Candidatus Acidoferrales bacterium]|nr:ferrochelatase [Candidatus Acidoferrales bacterium]
MSKAILLVNLGSPDSPSVPDVRRYLNEFLMDARVIDTPWLLRRFIVGMILINRPKESAHAYRSIWTPAGSPLIVTSRAVRHQLQARVDVPIELAMRYQNPSIESAVKSLSGRGIEEVLLIPLFPHYAMSSYETAVVRVQAVARKYAPRMKVSVQPPYGDAPDFIGALVANAGEYLRRDHDYLLFSFHGVPERHLKKSDPTRAHCLAVGDCCHTPSEAHKSCYRHQCYRTAEEFARAANLSAGKWSVSFQSRLGRDPWLKPYTDFELDRLARAGVKRLLIMSPAFVADCLETLEELGIRGKQTFFAAGGESFTLLPCLNEHPAWIAALENMAKKFLR